MSASTASELLNRSRKLVREHVSLRTRARMRRAQVRMQLLTHPWRTLPSVLVIGAMRAGTSSVSQYLSGHPDLVRGARKEVGYFSLHYSEGLQWYRAHFPTRAGMRGRQAFEATPDYLLDPRAAARAREVLPDVQLIVLLRDPAERSFSHFLHCRRLGLESLDRFEDALDREGERLAAFRAHPVGASDDATKSFLRFSYIERSRYGAQLARWLDHYPRQQVHVHFFSELFADPAKELLRMESELGVRDWLPKEFANHSYTAAVKARSSAKVLSPRARDRVFRELAEDQRALAGLLGQELPWRP